MVSKFLPLMSKPTSISLIESSTVHRFGKNKGAEQTLRDSLLAFSCLSHPRQTIRCSGH